MQQQTAVMVQAQHGIGFDKVYVAAEVSGHEVAIVQTQPEIAITGSPVR